MEDVQLATRMLSSKPILVSVAAASLVLPAVAKPASLLVSPALPSLTVLPATPPPISKQDSAYVHLPTSLLQQSVSSVVLPVSPVWTCPTVLPAILMQFYT